MTFGIPQIIYLVILIIRFGLILAFNGKPIEGNYSAGTSFVLSCFILALLYWGGFFG